MATFQSTIRNGAATVYVYEQIGELGVTAKDFAEQLDSFGKVRAINVRINSIGGDVFAGISMYNLLVSHRAKVTVDVDGLAASAASVIAMAGNPIRMAANAFMIVHAPWAILGGNANDLRHMADQLDAVEGALVDTYTHARGLKRDQVQEWVTAETTLGAADAVAVGLADEVTDATAIAASVDTSKFKFLPKAVREWQPSEPPETINLEAARRRREIQQQRILRGVPL